MTNKEHILQVTAKTICNAAIQYKTNLVGRTFMYVFDNRYIEVIYKSNSFKHLTGVSSSLSAKRFYSLAVKNQLTSKQIRFTSRHPYKLCSRKLKHIDELINITSSNSFILEEIKTQSQTFKFGATDTQFTLCFGADIDENDKLKSNLLIAQSLRDENCFSKSKNIFSVTYIFSKPNDQKEYDTILYANQSSANTDLPECIKPLLSSALQNKLATYPNQLVQDTHSMYSHY